MKNDNQVSASTKIIQCHCEQPCGKQSAFIIFKPSHANVWIDRQFQTWRKIPISGQTDVPDYRCQTVAAWEQRTYAPDHLRSDETRPESRSRSEIFVRQ